MSLCFDMISEACCKGLSGQYVATALPSQPGELPDSSSSKRSDTYCHVRHSGRVTLRVGGEARSRVRDAGRLSHVDQGGIRSGKRERE